jgi:hypothetical protein
MILASSRSKCINKDKRVASTLLNPFSTLSNSKGFIKLQKRKEQRNILVGMNCEWIDAKIKNCESMPELQVQKRQRIKKRESEKRRYVKRNKSLTLFADLKQWSKRLLLLYSPAIEIALEKREWKKEICEEKQKSNLICRFETMIKTSSAPLLLSDWNCFFVN